jgi:hypothetical protein
MVSVKKIPRIVVWASLVFPSCGAASPSVAQKGATDEVSASIEIKTMRRHVFMTTPSLWIFWLAADAVNGGRRHDRACPRPVGTGLKVPEYPLGGNAYPEEGRAHAVLEAHFKKGLFDRCGYRPPCGRSRRRRFQRRIHPPRCECAVNADI